MPSEVCFGLVFGCRRGGVEDLGFQVWGLGFEGLGFLGLTISPDPLLPENLCRLAAYL